MRCFGRKRKRLNKKEVVSEPKVLLEGLVIVSEQPQGNLCSNPWHSDVNAMIIARKMTYQNPAGSRQIPAGCGAVLILDCRDHLMLCFSLPSFFFFSPLFLCLLLFTLSLSLSLW